MQTELSELSELRKQLLDAACAPYRPVGIAHYQWARGKLGFDPIFDAILTQALIPDDARVLDLGCGRGFLASWVLSAERLHEQGQWPLQVAPPQRMRFQGVELVASEVRAGNRALQPLFGDRVSLLAGDMREAEIPAVEVVAMLDVLHYVPYADQDRLLDRIRSSLTGGGVFITRVGDAQAGMRFRISQYVDRFASFMQGHRSGRMWCRPLSQWVQALEARGFEVQSVPMSEGTPFANVMLVSRVP